MLHSLKTLGTSEGYHEDYQDHQDKCELCDCQVSASVKDLILRMVERSPHARIRLADVCSHPWVAQVRRASSIRAPHHSSTCSSRTPTVPHKVPPRSFSDNWSRLFSGELDPPFFICGPPRVPCGFQQFPPAACPNLPTADDKLSTLPATLCNQYLRDSSGDDCSRAGCILCCDASKGQ